MQLSYWAAVAHQQLNLSSTPFALWKSSALPFFVEMNAYENILTWKFILQTFTARKFWDLQYVCVCIQCFAKCRIAVQIGNRYIWQNLYKIGWICWSLTSLKLCTIKSHMWLPAECCLTCSREVVHWLSHSKLFSSFSHSWYPLLAHPQLWASWTATNIDMYDGIS